MKRNFAALLLLLVPALMASCWKTGEDWSLCGVDDNFVLMFRVQDGSDATFERNINSVNVYLFDAERQYVTHREVGQSELDAFKGVAFSVAPGTYYVVCWANAGENSQISAMQGNIGLENSYIEIVPQPTTGDPIYYAPYKLPVARSAIAPFSRTGDDYAIYSVVVPPKGTTVKELVFAKVHRTVQVYIKKYETTTLYDGQPPVVEKTGAGGRFDFLLNADLTPRSARQPSVYTTDANGSMYRAEFHSALIPIRNDMQISVYHPTSGALLATVNLEQYIADNHIADDSLIPIQILFALDASVSVTLPSWMDNEVIPD